MKKVIGGLFAAVLLVSPFTQTAFANEDEEVYFDPGKYYAEDIEGHWAQNDMENMLQANIIKGVRDADDLLYLQPNKSITRAEFTALVVRSLELKTSEPGKAFVDTQKHWAKNDINTASALGIVSGKSDMEFKPDMKITRAEIASIVARAFEATVDFETGTPKEFEDLKPGHWAYNHMRIINQVGIIKGTTATTVAPDKNANRAEATAMLKRSLWLEKVELPNEETIMDLVFNSEADTLDAINVKDVSGLYSINNETRYGFGHEAGAFEAWINEISFNAGETLEGEIVTEPVLEVTEHTTRIVKVNVENFVIDYTYTDSNKDIYEFSEDRSGEYYLIKRGGQWKVYTSDFYKEYLEIYE
jgi:S-layer homology domain